MQLEISDESVRTAVRSALAEARLDRYRAASYGDRELAFDLYLWNCRLCEAFYAPLHFAEITLRNGIRKHLAGRAGERWFEDRTFRGLLDERNKKKLEDALEREMKAHGDGMTEAHVVSALTLGYWDHLTTKRFERFLWAKGLKAGFPHAPADGLAVLRGKIDALRVFRNRIAHHEAIFDKGPTSRHQDALDVIGYACGTTAAWVAAASRVPAVISERPKPSRK